MKLTNFCPGWIVSIVTAHTAMDFLTASSSLTSIASKYSRGLSEYYEPIHPGIIESVAEDKLRTLAEIEAAENAVVILNAYIYRVYKFYPDNRPRKMTGLFTSEFKGSKTPIPEHKELTRTFKAFIFSIRSNVYNYAPPGWSIIEEPEVGWLGELVAEPSSIFDSF